MWEVGTGLPGISFSPHGAVASANFSPDGKHLVTASWDNSAKIWDAATGQALAKLEGAHDGYVNCAVFSPVGNVVLTASDDHTAKLWDARKGQVDGTLAGHADRVRSAAFSADGKLAVTASADKTASDLGRRIRRTTLQVLKGHAWGVLSAEFSRDGQRVITGSEDNTARIWDAADRRIAGRLKGHTAAVNWVGAFARRSPGPDRQPGQHRQAVGRRDGQGTAHPARPQPGSHGRGIFGGRPLGADRPAATARPSCGWASIGRGECRPAKSDGGTDRAGRTGRQFGPRMASCEFRIAGVGDSPTQPMRMASDQPSACDCGSSTAAAADAAAGRRPSPGPAFPGCG